MASFSENRGERAFKLHLQVTKSEVMRRDLLYKAVAYLNEIREEKLYKEILGDEDADFSAYLAQIEVFYTKARIHALNRIFKHLSMGLEIDSSRYNDIPPSRLVDILPIITKETAEEWFSKARTLTPRDWRIETRKAKGRITEEDDHDHDYQTYDVCTICGAKHKKHSP